MTYLVVTRTDRCSPLNPGWDTSADFLRSVAILYIVGFWHLCGYTPSLAFYNNRVTRLLTTCVLGLFVFLSGLLLSARYRFTRRGDIWPFYRRRFFRTYPLFFGALAAFYLVGLIDLKPFVLSAFLLNLLVNEELVTLWFATMIMVFYGLTPLLLFRYSMVKTAAIVVLLVVGLLAVHLRWGVFDLALAKYLPIFGAGLVAARTTSLRVALSRPVAALIGVLVFGAACWLEAGVKHVAIRLALEHAAVLGSLPVFFAFARLFPTFAARRIVSVLSYSSYALYLLHRVVFLLALKLFFPHSGVGVVAWLGGIVLPLTVVASYGVQRGYDRILGWDRI